MRYKLIRISPEFAEYLEKKRKQYKQNNGIDISYPKLTKLVAIKLSCSEETKPLRFKL